MELVRLVAVGSLASVGGATLAPPLLDWWRGPYQRWWAEQVARGLVQLGLTRLVPLHRVPVLVAMLLATVGASRFGLLGLLAGLGLAVVATVLVPRALDAWLERRATRADVELLRLLPELAAGIGRGESAEVLLDRLVVLVDEDRVGQRFDPLVGDLCRRAAAAARFTPRVHNACEILATSRMPTARLVATAWRQVGLGIDVPDALRQIARASGEDHALRIEIAGKIGPIGQQARIMLLLPLGMIALFGWSDPANVPRLLSFPAAWGLVVSAVGTTIAWAYLQSVLRRLQ